MTNKETAFLETLVKEAYKKITTLERALESARQPTPPEPIAVIGMGCRFPGADGPEAYWQLLIEGQCAIRDLAPDRWNPEAYAPMEAASTSRTAWSRGGFLNQVDHFDPLFFRISPLEALTMDPQQRLLLEVTWEALEHAAIAPDGLDGSKTGVFIGITGGQTLADLELIRSEKAMYAGTGQTPSIAAGRLSFILGLQGPSMAIDTACSSSMMAVHVAVGNLRSGECDLALAGGVNVLTPEANVLMANAGWLAADGHCKTFDVSADGHARSEGCGIIVLKRLSDAQRDGDKVWAVIRGSACNHDGRTSGLTVPNGPVQQALIRQALQNAGVQPAEVSYSEAHATGTSLGDVIEVSAIGAVYAGRNEPLLIGSVKPNLGHLESASGTTSLMKLILMLYHGELAPHIGIKQPNPNIPWSELPLQVVTKRRPWPANPATTKRIGGVSGFGFSGTNIHLILEEPPAIAAAEPRAAAPTHQIFTLAAKDETALQALATRYVTHLADHPAVALPDLCYTVNKGRAHFPHRLSIVSDGTADLAGKLTAFAAGKRTIGLVRGQMGASRPKIAFLFSGLGGQAVGMGRQLYAAAPAFREAIDRCAVLLADQLDQPLTEVLYGEDTAKGTELLAQTIYAEPALFAVEYALAQLWQAWGIKPDVVLGHSLGEYVAACVAGVLSLEDALRLVTTRCRLVQAASVGGATASIFAGVDQVQALIAPWADQVSVAGINSPEEILIAGEATAVEQALAAVQDAGLDGKRLNIAHAAHSPLMAPILDQFTQVAETITYRTPRIKLISSVTGAVCTQLNAAHWRRHLREPVRFAASMATLQSTDCRCMVEIGPQPVLLWLGRQNWTDNAPVAWLPSLWPLHADWLQLYQTLAELYVRGVTVDWPALYWGKTYQKVILPTYPFQRKRYRLDQPAPAFTAPPLNTTQAKSMGDETAASASTASATVHEPVPALALLAQLESSPPDTRVQQILAFLQEQVATVLYLKAADVHPTTNLVEVGMDSMMAMTILNGCREALGFVLYPRDLYERPVLENFAVYLAAEFERIHSGTVGESQKREPGNSTEGEALMGSALQAQVAGRKYAVPAAKNPPMLFVLSAPRSGSTFLRVMLAGHPALFAPPELHLLWLEQMHEFPQLDYLGEGLQRTLMALHGVDATAAQAMIDQWIAEDCSAQEVYRRLQAAAAPRVLVDKSPTYGGHLHVLQRIEQLFEQPKVLHLVRHPYAMIDSFVRNRIDRIGGYTGLDAFAAAEQVWVDSNRHIQALLAAFPAERQFTIRYEDLVRNAQEQMEQLSDWLALPFAEAMLHPYEGERMTDGVHAGSIPLGDMNFGQHNGVKQELAEVWRTIQLPRPLGQEAQALATAFGYELPSPLVPDKPQTVRSPLKSPRSENGKAAKAGAVSTNGTAAQNSAGPSVASASGNAADFVMQSSYLDVRGLSLCLCTWGPEAGPPVVCLHGLLDQGASWNEVAVALAQQGYRVIAPDLRGHGCSEHVGAGRSYQFMDFIGDIDALLHQLDQGPVTLVGHSLGATLATVYAAARPDRVARLLLVEPYVPTAGRRPDLVEQIATRLDYFNAALQHTVLANVQAAAQQLRQTAPRMAAELAHRLAERLTKPAEHGTPGVIWRWDPQLKSRQIDSALGQEMDQAAYLALLQRIQMQIEAPLSVIYGRESDRQSPAIKQWLAKEFSNVEVVEVAGGHNLHVEAPIEVANTLVSRPVHA